uniref:site-specific DNA-methyltransferase n=1 Tax=uncultured Erythrobacter sp. TaxID=263913 RepID=UPI002629FC67|nr:site-specific DNA-methyltransferase [uncultured Erythrobacter sp.]
MPELNFKGKEFVYNHHLTVPFRPLEPQADKGIGEPSLDGNLVIHGDNLHALKALLPMYAGKVDCIYIDPPYNTGSEDWRYNDNVNSPMIREWLLENPVGVDDGLRHDKWCAMIWPRLRLLRDLLADEGVIFVSIDSNEFASLKLILDEAFGAHNYIGEFVWKSRQNKDNRNENGLSNDHEFILCYGAPLAGEPRSASDYKNTDNDNRGPWASGNMVGLASKEARPNLHYDLINPQTGINYGCPRRGWRFEPQTMDRLIEERRVLWPEKKTGRPRRKVFLDELPARTNVSSAIHLPVYTNTGSKRLRSIMGDDVFEFPKPPELIEHLIGLIDRDDITVLDSFAGSGSTAEAVLLANSKDMGRRKFILVEGEEYADSLTAERVRRVIRGYTFKGKKREELLREKVTLARLQKAGALLEKVQKIETLDGDKYDIIKPTMKDGWLVVTGEHDCQEKAPGLGGTFTYCKLGDSIDMDGLLSGADLPEVQPLAALLYHTSTSQAFDASQLKPALAIGEHVYRLGSANGRHLWLFYKPDLDWLKSGEAALSLSNARAIAASEEGNHLVFAPAKFVSRDLLAAQRISVEYAPLPYALYRVETA